MKSNSHLVRDVSTIMLPGPTCGRVREEKRAAVLPRRGSGSGTRALGGQHHPQFPAARYLLANRNLVAVVLSERNLVAVVLSELSFLALDWRNSMECQRNHYF